MAAQLFQVMVRYLFVCLVAASMAAWAALPPVPLVRTGTDAAGRIYVAGLVSSQAFDASEGALQPKYTPGTCVVMGWHSFSTIPCQDAAVMRLDASGTRVEAATYIGGEGMEDVRAMQVARDGSVYLSLSSGSKRMESVGLSTEENLLGWVVVKLDPDLKRAVKVTRLPATNGQDMVVLPDESMVFSAVSCDGTRCLSYLRRYDAPGTQLWEKSQPYPVLISAAANSSGLWATTEEFGVPVAIRIRLSDGAEELRVRLADAGYNATRIAGTADGGAVVATALMGGGFALVSVKPDGSRGATSRFKGDVFQLEADGSGVVHAIGSAGLELPTPSRSLRRCMNTASDTFALGWRVATGELTYATFLDRGSMSMALRNEEVVLGRTLFDVGTSRSEIQILTPAQFPEQPACINAQVSNFGSAVVFSIKSTEQVAPGEFLWIYGSGLGPKEEARVEMDGSRDKAPRALAGTRVLFDNEAAAVLSVSDHRVLVQVPYAVAERQHTSVQVEREGVVTNGIALEVRDVVPASIPSAAGAVYNPDWSSNSETNPAAPGDVVTVFLSGAGKLEGITDDAAAIRHPLPALTTPVTAIISGSGGQAVTFAGGVAGQLPGLVQLNVRIGSDFAFHGRMQLELWFGPVGTSVMTMVELFVR